MRPFRVMSGPLGGPGSEGASPPASIAVWGRASNPAEPKRSGRSARSGSSSCSSSLSYAQENAIDRQIWIPESSREPASREPGAEILTLLRKCLKVPGLSAEHLLRTHRIFLVCFTGDIVGTCLRELVIYSSATAEIDPICLLEPCSTCCRRGVQCPQDYYDLETLKNYFDLTKPEPLPAKEDTQDFNLFSHYEQPSQPRPELPVNHNPGELETIWNSSASHPPYDVKIQRLFLITKASNSFVTIVGFRKGWNEGWGNLPLPPSYRRIGKLLDRDYVWVVTQTMVSFKNLALWAKHTVLTYKVYPGFWGRPTPEISFMK